LQLTIPIFVVMHKQMGAKGGQHYAIPRMKKGTLERIQQLPIRLRVDKEIYQDAVNFIAV